MLQNLLQFVDGSLHARPHLVPMCLIALALHAHPRYRLVLAANRDEFHARPAAAADFLADRPDIYGGRDLQAGGSWLLASRSGRVAAVTNVRTGTRESGLRSRGELVRLGVEAEAIDSGLARLADHAQDYGRFNLLAFDGQRLGYLGNHPRFHHAEVGAGLHTLSNAALDVPWPKTQRLRDALQTWISTDSDEVSPLLAALADRRIAVDADLPQTGVPLDWERRLSAAFIVGRDYGTRVSSVVLVGDEGVRFVEQRFGPEGVFLGASDRML